MNNYKSSAGDIFERHVKSAELITGNKLKCVQLDGAGEFLQIIEFCKRSGIHWQRSEPHQHQQHGVAEKANRDNMDRALTMIHSRGLPTYLWGEACNSANYIKNRTPSSKLRNKMTPIERFTGIRPDLSNLRVFGCLSWTLIPMENRLSSVAHKRNGKLSQRGTRCQFVGYAQNGKAWKFYDPIAKTIYTSRNARFDEETFLSPIEQHPFTTDSFTTISVKDAPSLEEIMLEDEGHKIFESFDGASETKAPNNRIEAGEQNSDRVVNQSGALSENPDNNQNPDTRDYERESTSDCN
jgi:hypothetical protein